MPSCFEPLTCSACAAREPERPQRAKARAILTMNREHGKLQGRDRRILRAGERVIFNESL